MIESHRLTVANFQRLTFAIDQIEKQRKVAQMSGGSRRQLSESRCVGNLKVLGSNKLEFKNWNDKLVNATAQSFGTSWRTFMKDLNRKLDQDRKVLDDLEINLINGVDNLGDLNRISEDLFYVLVEKTGRCEPSRQETGDGLRAYMRL